MRGARWLALLLLLAPCLLLGQSLISVPGVAGQVRDSQGPVAGSRVRLRGHRPEVLTDLHGHFFLPGMPRRAEHVTAAHEGYLITGAPAGRLPRTLDLTPLPTEDCERYRWVGPDPDSQSPRQCGNCHAEIHREWAASGHARSVSDRHFLNLYEGSDWQGRQGVSWGLLPDHPDGAGVCTACHAPTVEFDDPAYFDLRLAQGTGARGVHCDYCHKVAGVAGDVGLTHGRFGLQLRRPASGQLFFGPLDDVDRGEDAWTPLYGQSRYCASCHEGTVFGVHVYGTYTEWLASPAGRAGQQCQSCHMTPTGTLHNIAPGHGGIERDPHTLANHRFFSGSQADMLRRALRVSPAWQRRPEGVRVSVEVRADEVGHRLPTGFVDRHLLLIVEACSGTDRPVKVLEGPTLPDLAGHNLAGLAGRLYGKVLHDFEGQTPAPFWRADPEVSDTRLEPGRPDRVELLFPPETRQLRVRLVYRRFWQEVADAKGWPDNELLVDDQRLSLADTPSDWGNPKRRHSR